MKFNILFFQETFGGRGVKNSKVLVEVSSSFSYEPLTPNIHENTAIFEEYLKSTNLKDSLASQPSSRIFFNRPLMISAHD